MLYTREKEESNKANTEGSDPAKTGTTDKAGGAEVSASASDCTDPMKGLDETARLCFQVRPI